MKSTVFLFASNLSDYVFEKAFDSRSALELAYIWAKKIENCQEIVFFAEENLKNSIASETDSNVRVICKEQWTKRELVSEMTNIIKQNKTDYAVFSFADTPFLNSSLTSELIETHEKYKAEYTFADGYPYGLSPEVIDGGALGILTALCSSTLEQTGRQPVSRDALFSIMSGDINSFEIETVISPEDYRLLRLEFECSSKINFDGCKAVWNQLKNAMPSEADAVKLCNMASENIQVLKTVPAFFNLQITSSVNHKLCYLPQIQDKPDMSFENLKNLLEQIKSLTDRAVISLSAFGEPLLHPDFIKIVREILQYKNFKVLIETDGILVTRKICEELAEISGDRIDWIVRIDAMNSEMYSKLHDCNPSDFDKALQAVNELEKNFENHVYPQFVRMKQNETQLENFFRFWKEKESPSKGQFIIQKYNSFCGLLPEEKPADLSPLERKPCWHIRRDMVILSDGSVPVCIQQYKNSIGNVFNQPVAEVWSKIDQLLKDHVNKNYSGACGHCDEYYTFNF